MATETIQRCEICNWTLAEDRSKGCVPGDCSYRSDDPAEQAILRKRRELREARLNFVYGS